jgi:hypothetical protein
LPHCRHNSDFLFADNLVFFIFASGIGFQTRAPAVSARFNSSHTLATYGKRKSGIFGYIVAAGNARAMLLKAPQREACMVFN